jgi:hypothetical protein
LISPFTRPPWAGRHPYTGNPRSQTRSCHTPTPPLPPPEYAAITFLYNRLNIYNLHEHKYRLEEDTIHNIIHNNAFPPPYPYPKDTTPMTDEQLTNNTQKWVCFTYVGKETIFITNLFRKTDLKTVLCTNNIIQSLLMHRQQTPDKYTQSTVYKLTCPDCNKAYVGQTGSSFITRFNEHKNAFRLNYCTSNFATHLTEKSHSFGPIHSTMQVLKHQTKGTHLNTVERFYIYKEYINNNHLNDEHTITPNRICETLLKTPIAITPQTPPTVPFNDGNTVTTTQHLAHPQQAERTKTQQYIVRQPCLMNPYTHK